MDLRVELIRDAVWLNSPVSSAALALAGVFLTAIMTNFFNSNNQKKMESMQKKLNQDNIDAQAEINKKLIDADLVSKSRIEWIQEVRNILAEYIAISYEVIIFLDEEMSALHNDDLNSIKKSKMEMRETSLRLGLQFGPDNSNVNENIIKFIDEFTYHIYQLQGGGPEAVKEYEDNLKVFKDFMSTYLKYEWKRANRSITDNESEELQKKNKFLNKIKKITDDYQIKNKELKEHKYPNLYLKDS